MEVFWSEGRQSLQQGEWNPSRLAIMQKFNDTQNVAWRLYDMKRTLKIKVRGRRGSRNDHSIAILHRIFEQARLCTIVSSLVPWVAVMSLGMRRLVPRGV